MKTRTRGHILGGAAEARFIADAMGRGYTVSKPFGDGTPYDLIVDANSLLSTVQVKASSLGVIDHMARNWSPQFRYSFSANGGVLGGVDVLAFWFVGPDRWLLLPAKHELRKNIQVSAGTLAEMPPADWAIFERRSHTGNTTPKQLQFELPYNVTES